MSDIEVQEAEIVETPQVEIDPTEEPAIEPDAVEPEPEDQEPAELALEDLPLPGDEKEEKKNDLPKWAEKRLSKKEREINEAKAQTDLLRQENERLKSLSMTQAPANVPSSMQPQRDEYDNEGDYISAIVDFRNNAMMNKLIAQKNQQEVIEKEEKFRSDWMNSEEVGLKKYNDFDEKFEVLNDKSFPGNRMMAEAIIDSPYKEDIQYFLGSNPDHARKIALLPGIQSVKKIAEIESRYAARKKAATVTKAPPLIGNVRTNKGGVPKVNPEQIPQEDFDKWYKEKYGK